MLLVKHIHVGCVILTGAFFAIRGVWMIADSALLQRRWVKRLPPVIDTVLLASAIWLAVQLHQYPFVHPWLTAKVLALFAYIGFGMLALTYGRTKPVRIVSLIAALLCYGYIVAVALTRDPLPL